MSKTWMLTKPASILRGFTRARPVPRTSAEPEPSPGEPILRVLRGEDALSAPETSPRTEAAADAPPTHRLLRRRRKDSPMQ